MQLVQHFHACRYIFPAACMGISCTFVVFRNLISGVTVHVDDMLRNLQRLDCAVHIGFFLAVDQELCARPRDTADVMQPLQLEQERFVRHAGL